MHIHEPHFSIAYVKKSVQKASKIGQKAPQECLRSVRKVHPRKRLKASKKRPKVSEHVRAASKHGGPR